MPGLREHFLSAYSTLVSLEIKKKNESGTVSAPTSLVEETDS